ncbi:rCG59226 [Rattus norvegicus]|uniref:RCG59226 n=1 Tax=Rattus norvegicus TaxID=10116 RepID=A6K7P2_RAT|nr:rCG59226 [Rattus norvegicus]
MSVHCALALFTMSSLECTNTFVRIR